MLENAKKQLILVLLVLAAAAISFWKLPLVLGTDLAGGSELIYTLDPAELPENLSETDLKERVAETVAIIQDRLDPDGTKNIAVSPRGRDGVYIELPGMNVDEARAVEAKITRLGRLETRIVAEATFNEDDISFNMQNEKKRLNDWINTGANRDLLLKDPLAIRQFNRLGKEEGGPESAKLTWYPHKITTALTPNPDGSDRWGVAFSTFGNEFGNNCVKVFDDQAVQQPPTADGFLLEYVPVNMQEMHFSGEDLDGSKVRPGVDENGAPAVHYVIKPERAGEYADWSEKYIGKHSAIILDNFVRSAPYFVSRIPGRGQITGFKHKEAQELADILKRGSLKVSLIQQSETTIGPTLGGASIQRGKFSILGGAGIVLLFLLFYYRTAGIIACVSMLLNVALVFGALSLVRATLTLPGLAGLVLTIGMAVDANILIYERIREEIRRGKALLQAVRQGFERAMVTILDANITTFLAGCVLYFIGVGPVRGFAVTLMVGIATSLFTAFFVTRLMFHYLLLNEKRTSLGMQAWFTKLRFNFLKFAKPAFALSFIAIVTGLGLFASAKPGDIYGLDFTGGVSARVVTRDAMTSKQIADILKKDKAATAKFPTQTVNTAGADVKGGKSRTFQIKLKVADAEAATTDEAGRQKKTARFQALLQAALNDVLAPTAFTSPALRQGVERQREWLASVELNYVEPVQLAALQQLLTARGLSTDEAEVAPLDSAVDGKHRQFLLEFDVAKDDVQDKDALVEYTRDLLVAREGDPVKLPKLSNPIPDVAEIGGRMVGELRNSAIGAMIVALFLIVMFIRVRFHEYKYGLAAVAALVHDVLITLGVVVLANAYLGVVSAEIDLAMIAAFLTIIGYSINDTIVIFDRVRENLKEQESLGDKAQSFAQTLNHSINQTLTRTILTSMTTMIVVVAQFAVNYQSGSSLEGLSFALIIGVMTGTYSTIFIASPVVLWLRSREKPGSGGDVNEIRVEIGSAEEDSPTVPAGAN